MAYKIIWSTFAETQLDEIYEFYEMKVSSRVASKLVKGIIDEPNKLLKTSFIGQEEEFFKGKSNSIPLFSF